MNGIIVLVRGIEPDNEMEMQLPSNRGEGKKEPRGFPGLSPSPTEMINEFAVPSPRQHCQGLRLFTPKET